MSRIVRDNLPSNLRGSAFLIDKRGVMTHGPRMVSVKEYSRVAEAQRRAAGGDTMVNLAGLSPKATAAVKALVRSLRDEN